MVQRSVFASTIFFATIAAFVACVGDDPTTSSPVGADGGGTGSSSGSDGTTPNPGTDGSSTSDGGPCDLSADFTETEPIASLDMAGSPEASLTLSQDEREAIFMSLRDPLVAGGAPADNSNLFIATRADLGATFGSASTTLTSAINAPTKMDIDPTLSPNGQLLLWTQRMTEGGSEHLIQYAERSSSTAAFEPRGAVTFGSTGSYPGGAYPKGTHLIPNGALYLVMQTGGIGKYRLFRAAPVSLGKYAAPVEQTFTGGQPIFTDAVAVSPDELTLYTGGGANDADIAVLTRSKVDDPWGPARPLTKISSASWDQPHWLSPDGCRLYLSSGRSGAGDIFVARRK
jgi:hypothetical protein